MGVRIIMIGIMKRVDRVESKVDRLESEMDMVEERSSLLEESCSAIRVTVGRIESKSIELSKIRNVWLSCLCCLLERIRKDT